MRCTGPGLQGSKVLTQPYLQIDQSETASFRLMPPTLPPGWLAHGHCPFHASFYHSATPQMNITSHAPRIGWSALLDVVRLEKAKIASSLGLASLHILDAPRIILEGCARDPVAYFPTSCMYLREPSRHVRHFTTRCCHSLASSVRQKARRWIAPRGSQPLHVSQSKTKARMVPWVIRSPALETE